MNLLLLIIVFLVDPGRDKNSKCQHFGSTYFWGRHFGSNFFWGRNFGSTFFWGRHFGSTFFWGRPLFRVDILGRPFFGVDRSELSQPVDFQVDPSGRLRTLVNNQSLENIVAEFFAIFSFTSNYDIIKFESILKKWVILNKENLIFLSICIDLSETK